ncbi:MAG: 30S ribosomal protein S6 [Candidatus Aminicenantes bacterium]|nr:30S ribosomal protein S6 [Candidatus Aminicenantes bacterium]
MNRKYEIGFIINPESSEEEVKKVVDSVVESIKRNNGIIENVDEWGRRQMAYSIGRHNEGFYVFINADLPGAAFFDIERRLKLSERVMRYMILRLDDRLRKANKLTRKWQRMEKQSKKAQLEESEAVLEEKFPDEVDVEEEADND